MSCMAMAHHIQLLVMPSARSAHAAAACETRRGKSIVISALRRLAIPYHEDLCLTISSSPPRRRPSLTQSTPSLTGSHRGESLRSRLALPLRTAGHLCAILCIGLATPGPIITSLPVARPVMHFRRVARPRVVLTYVLPRARYLLRRLVWAVAGAG